MPVTLATAVTTVRGVANALAAVAKPHARLLSACFLLYKLLVAVLLRNRRRAGTATGLTSLVGDVLSTHTQAVLVFIGSFLACWVDPVVSTDRYTTKPGVYYHGQRAQRLARKAGLEQAVVDGERDLWPRGGDICTVVASESWKLFQAGTRNLQYFRTLFPLCVPKCERASTTMWRQNYMDTFAVDWFFCDSQQQRKLTRQASQVAQASWPSDDDAASPEIAVQLQRRAKQVDFVRLVAHAAVNPYLRTRPRKLSASQATGPINSPVPGFGSEIVTPTGLAVLIPGVGGDSRAGYINSTAAKYISLGFNVCVLNPRGLTFGHRVEDVHNIYDALDLSDLHSLLKLLHAQTPTPRSSPEGNCGAHQPRPKIVLVGFSLGAVSIVRYAHRMRDFFPSSVVAAVSVGGACNSEVAEWSRYKAIYQRIIVPKIRDDILGMYFNQLANIYGGEQALNKAASQITSYEDLVTKFLGKVKQSHRQRLEKMHAYHLASSSSSSAKPASALPRTLSQSTTAVWASAQTAWPQGSSSYLLTSAVWLDDDEYTVLRQNRAYDTWSAFRAQAALYRMPKVAPTLDHETLSLDEMSLGCDVLLIAAANDPFHHTDSIVPGMAGGHKNPRFIGMVTRYGGHIGWTRLSQSNIFALDYDYIGEVSVRYTMAAFDEEYVNEQSSPAPPVSPFPTLPAAGGPKFRTPTSGRTKIAAPGQSRSQTLDNDFQANQQSQSVRDVLGADAQPFACDSGVLQNYVNPIDKEVSVDELGKMCAEFTSRGGKLFLFQEAESGASHTPTHIGPATATAESALFLRPGDAVFPMCHAGQNRSQVMYALVHDINLAASVPLATSRSQSLHCPGSKAANVESAAVTTHSLIDEDDANVLHLMAPHGAESGFDPYTCFEDLSNENYFGFCHTHLDMSGFDAQDYWQNERFRVALGRPKASRFGAQTAKQLEANEGLRLMPTDCSPSDLRQVEAGRTRMHEYFSANYFKADAPVETNGNLAGSNGARKNKNTPPVNRRIFLCFMRSVAICLSRILEANPLPPGLAGDRNDLRDLCVVGFPYADNIGNTGQEGSSQEKLDAATEAEYRNMYELYSRLVRFDGTAGPAE